MDIRCSAWLAAIFLVFPMSPSNAGSQKASHAGPDGITVRVYNYARISSHGLERTQTRVSEIFIKAGFRIHWVHCPLCDEAKSQYPDCTDQLGPDDIILKIMPRIDMEKIGFKKDTFGFTAGKNIMISTERLYEIARDSGQTCHRILGLAVAHEIGHALLRTSSHSSRGIMCLRWYSKDLQLESQQSVCFTEEQIDRMYRNWMATRDAERPGGTARTSPNPEK